MDLSCLIIDEMHESIIHELQKLGIRVKYEPNIQREQIKEQLKSFDGLIVRSKTLVDQDLLLNASKLKFVARAGAGLDMLDLEYLAKRKIQVFNAPEGNRDALAEHAMGMLLCLLNKIHIADSEVRNKIWQREANRGVELMGKTVGIIGYGFMGQAFAKRLSAFGCNILAYDKFRRGFSDDFVEEASLELIFQQAEILSLHIPLSEDTQNMVNNNFLNRFKHSIYLLNTARGKVLNLQDLYRNLSTGKVKAAALDVMENEKLKALIGNERAIFDKLATMPNVLFTPHVAGWTYESYRKISQELAKKIGNLHISKL